MPEPPLTAHTLRRDDSGLYLDDALLVGPEQYLDYDLRGDHLGVTVTLHRGSWQPEGPVEWAGLCLERAGYKVELTTHYPQPPSLGGFL